MNPTRLLADFAAATAFLTRIPAPTPTGRAEPLAEAAWAFPLVGAGIGAVMALTFGVSQLLLVLGGGMLLLAGTASAFASARDAV